MNTQNVVYPRNGMLFGNTKEQSTDTCYLYEPQKHYAKRKKPVTKDHISTGKSTENRVVVTWGEG